MIAALTPAQQWAVGALVIVGAVFAALCGLAWLAASCRNDEPEPEPGDEL